MWHKIREILRNLWNQVFKRSFRKDTLLDTAKLKMFGLEITVTRELPKNIPYELTVVVPRAELRKDDELKCKKDSNLEILLNSITIAHSPRIETKSPKPSESTA